MIGIGMIFDETYRPFFEQAQADGGMQVRRPDGQDAKPGGTFDKRYQQDNARPRSGDDVQSLSQKSGPRGCRHSPDRHSHWRLTA